MSFKSPNSLQQAYYKWKSLRLPWRKKFLVGLDLQGNTFWEFCDTLSSQKLRMRRICHPQSTTQYSEIKISPQWHQWLRHTRKNPPSLTEQSQDLVRQRNLKVLAAEADARWAAKPSFLNAPQKDDDNFQRTKHLMDEGAHTPSTKSSDTKEVRNAIRHRFEESPQRTELGNNLGGAAGGNLKSKSSDITRQETGKDERSKPAEDPWKQARGGPSEGWQPRTWDGNTAAPKR